MNATQDTRLGTESIPKLMVQLAVPSVIAQLINVLYNIVDRIYIGRIPEVGHLALTGVGVTFPILMLISAFSAFVGAGGAPLAAISMGRGDKKKAEEILGNSTAMLLIFAVVLTAVFQIFNNRYYLCLEQVIRQLYIHCNISLFICGERFLCSLRSA